MSKATETPIGNERLDAFEALMNWLRENGARFSSTATIDKRITLKTYTFAGEMLIVQETNFNGGIGYEFFVPIGGGQTWSETRETLAKRLEASKVK